MSIATAIAATIQRITLDVRVDGRAVPEVSEASVSLGYDQANAQATLTCAARPAWAAEGARVAIGAGYNGSVAQVFGGELSGLTWEDGPGRVGLDCRDLLARTRLPWGGDLDVLDDPDLPPEIQPGSRVYESQTSDAIVRNLLEAYGIPSSMAHIEGSGWILGTVRPVVLKQGDAGWSLISRIDDLEGYTTFTDSAGVIRRIRVSASPGAAGALTITTAQLIERPRRTRSREGIVNRCIVTGLTYEGLTIGGPGVAEAHADNPYVPDPPAYLTTTIQDDLIEDDATALAIAQRVVADQNRRPEGLELTIVGDPRVQPGMTLTVTEDALETGGPVNVFVMHVDHRITATSSTTAIRTTGGALSGYATQPPIAAFDAQLFLEAEDTGSGVTGLIVGVADGSQSYDPDGQIASYAWTVAATGATPDPSSGSGPIVRFTVPSSATDSTLTLTVTDNDGLMNALSRTIPIDATTMLVEDLYTAEGGTVACTTDGEQTWREQSVPSGSATGLAAFAPAWGQVWGSDSGHVYATFDSCATALTDLGAPHGAVSCSAVWVHETDATRVWAGFDDGDVWQAAIDRAAKTATWARRGNVGAGPVREIREGITALGSLRATAGAGAYGSEDAGNSWSLLHTFDTAWRMAAGWDRNLASGLNATPPLFEESGSTPTVPGGVTHLRGLTFGWRTRALYAADDAAGLYTTDDTLASLTLHADSAPAGVNHMIRSGNLDGVIYLACGDGTGTNGAAKWLPGTKAPWMIRRTASRAVAMIGYGAAHLPIVAGPYTILMLPRGASGAADKLWITVDGGLTWTGKALPEANKDDWFGVRANPINPNKLLLYRHNNGFVTNDNALYASDDFGDTWTTVFTNIGMADQYLSAIAWSPVSGTAWVSSQPTLSGHGYALRGAATTYSAIDLGTRTQYGVSPGAGADIIYGDVDGAQHYVDAANGLHAGASGALLPLGFFATLPGARAAAHVRENAEETVKVVADYRSGAWSAISGTLARASIGVLADGTIVCGGRADGVQEIADAWGSPAVTAAAFSGVGIGAVASDAQTHTIAAAIYGSGSPSTLQPAVRDASGTWALLARPPLATDLADAIELVVRRV